MIPLFCSLMNLSSYFSSIVSLLIFIVFYNNIQDQGKKIKATFGKLIQSISMYFLKMLLKIYPTIIKQSSL